MGRGRGTTGQASATPFCGHRSVPWVAGPGEVRWPPRTGAAKRGREEGAKRLGRVYSLIFVMPSSTPQPTAPSSGSTRPLQLREAPGALPDESPQAAASAPRLGLAGWLIAPLLLSATLAGIAFVLRGPDQLFLWAFGSMFGIALLWVLVSVFFPAPVDRTCPECGATALARIDPQSTRGLICTACGWRDETTSSFLLAEAEGPLEETVLRERAQRRAARRAGTRPTAEPQRTEEPAR